MDKEIIIEAAKEYSKEQIFFGTYQEGFIAGAEFVLPKWIPVGERLPKKNCAYGVVVLATDGKNRWICNYTTGKEIEVELEDGEKQMDFDVIGELVYLKPGWYECVEQRGGMYDEIWIARKPIHWMPLPSLPKK